MPAVTTMHEQMHEWAGEQQKPWQKRNHMRCVLSDQEVASDGEKAQLAARQLG